MISAEFLLMKQKKSQKIFQAYQKKKTKKNNKHTDFFVYPDIVYMKTDLYSGCI